MAEAFYAAIAPHNPLGPISLAAGIHLAASIPNFLCQEQVTLGTGYIKTPFKVENGYVKIPDEKERRRVQEIIEELRTRSNDFSRPKSEREYINRLLNQFE